MISERWHLSEGLQRNLLNSFILDLQSSEQSLHYEVALLLNLEVLTSLTNRALEGLNRNLCQIYHAGVDIANSSMQDLAYLLITYLLLEVLVKELTEETQCLNRRKSVLQIGIS